MPDRSAPSTRSVYNSPLRARQKEQTGTLILDAVADILRRADLSAVTIAEVARVAEVTERTVYRHYKTRDDLLRAFWPWQLERMGGSYVNAPRSLKAFLRTLPEVFEGWDREQNLVRAVFFSPENRQVRAPAMATRLAIIEGFLAELAPGLAQDEQRKVAAAIMSLASVTNWVFLRDTCGYDGRTAGEIAVRGIELILAGLVSGVDESAAR